MVKRAFLPLFFLLAAFLLNTPVLQAQSIVKTPSGLSVDGAWARGGKGTLGAVVYLYLTNLGDTTQRITKAHTPIARWVEMQRAVEDKNGLMTLEPMASVMIPAKSFVVMGPNALHLMLMGLDKPLQIDTEFPLTVEVDGFGPLTFKVRVMPPSFNPIDAYAGGSVLEKTVN